MLQYPWLHGIHHITLNRWLTPCVPQFKRKCCFTLCLSNINAIQTLWVAKVYIFDIPYISFFRLLLPMLSVKCHHVMVGCRVFACIFVCRSVWKQERCGGGQSGGGSRAAPVWRTWPVLSWSRFTCLCDLGRWWRWIRSPCCCCCWVWPCPYVHSRVLHCIFLHCISLV